MLDYFRGRRPWGQFLRFVTRLPNHGHYKALLADDEDYARAVTADQPAEPSPMTMLGYGPVESRLDTLIDVLVAANCTGTPPKTPRPVTAFTRLSTRDTRNRHRARVAALLGPAR